MLLVKCLLLLLLSVHSHQMILRVQRYPLRCGYTKTVCFLSNNTFTSKQSTDFCKTLNGECIGKDCMNCRCKPNTVFLSYQQGCKSWTGLRDLYNGTSWINLQSTDFVPLIFPTTSSYEQRVSLQTHSPYGYCKLNASYIINLLNGKAMPINESLFQVNGGYFSMKITVKISEKNQGALIALDFDCKRYFSSNVKAIFMFQINGTTKISEPDNSPEKHTNQHVALYIVVPVIAFLLLVLLFVFGVRRRRKNIRRNKSQCAHYINEEKNESDSRNQVYEDIHKIHSTKDSKQTINQEVENIYYQTTTSESQHLYVAPQSTNTNDNVNISQENPEYMCSSQQPIQSVVDNNSTEYSQCYGGSSCRDGTEISDGDSDCLFKANHGDKHNSSSMDGQLGKNRIHSKQNPEHLPDDSIIFLHSNKNSENVYENKHKGYDVVGSILH